MVLRSLPGGIAETIKFKCLILKISEKNASKYIYRKLSYKSVSSDYLGVICKYEKDRETSPIEKSCFMASKAEGLKTKLKYSK